MTSLAPHAATRPKVSGRGRAPPRARPLRPESSETAELPSERDQNFLLRTPRGPFVLELAGPDRERRPSRTSRTGRSPGSPSGRRSCRVPRLARAVAGRAGAPALVSARNDPGRGAPALAGALRGSRRAPRPAGHRAVGLPACRGRRPGPPLGPGARARKSSAATGARSPTRPGASSSSRFAALYGSEVAPLLRESSAQRDPQRRQRLQPPRRPADRGSRGSRDRGPSGFRRHGRDLDGLRARGGRSRTRIFGQADPLAAARRLVAGLPRRPPPLGAGARRRVAAWRPCASARASASRPTAARPSPATPTSSSARPPPGKRSGAWPRCIRVSRAPPCATPAACRPARRRPRSKPGFARTASEFAPARRRRPLARRRLRPLGRQPRVPDARGDASTRRRMTPRLFSKMREAGTNVRDRPLRRGAARLRRRRFRVAPPAASIPSGGRCTSPLDLFLAPGSPVYAPLAGTRPRRPRQRRALRLRPDGDPRARPGGRAALLHALRPPRAGLPARAGRAERQVARGQRIGAIGAPPGNGDWPPHVHFQIVADLLDRERRVPRRRLGERARASGSRSRRTRARCSASTPRTPASARRRKTPRASRRSGGAGSARASRSRTARRSRSCAAPARPSTTRAGREFLDMVNNVAHVGHAPSRGSSPPARGRWRSSTPTRATCTPRSSATPSG